MFLEGPAHGARLALLAALSLALMVLDHRQHRLDQVRAALLAVAAPVLYVARLPAEAARWSQEAVKDRRTLREENAALRARITVLEARLQRLEALERENLRLRELLGAPFQPGLRIAVAEVIAADLDPYRQQVRIDRGAGDGVQVGQAVISSAGVVGQVSFVAAGTATVTLLTDPGHAIPVEVQRNGLRTLALGTGTPDRLALPYLPNHADIRPGDRLVSSGLGGRFPRGYPVAEVVVVEPRPGRPFARVEARPSAALDRLRELLLVWPGEAAP
nr:rod shape-determining protein MreC [Inmirania thermothiophila]